MKNLVKHVLKFSAATIAIAVPLITSSYSANAQQANIGLAQCQNNTITLSGRVPNLFALCPTTSRPEPRGTFIVLNGYENRGGNLVFVGSGTRSSFQNSCSALRVNRDVLSAECRRPDGTPNRTSIRIRNIVVRDGTLVQI
jgi:hypothetical protein